MEDREVPTDPTSSQSSWTQLSDAQAMEKAISMMEAQHEAELQLVSEAQSQSIATVLRTIGNVEDAAGGREQEQLGQIAERRAAAAASRLKTVFYAASGAARDNALEAKINTAIDGRHKQQTKSLNRLRNAYADSTIALKEKHSQQKYALERAGGGAARDFLQQAHGRTGPPLPLQRSWSQAQRPAQGPTRDRDRDDGTMYRVAQNDPALAAYRQEQCGPNWNDYVPPATKLTGRFGWIRWSTGQNGEYPYVDPLDLRPLPEGILQSLRTFGRLI